MDPSVKISNLYQDMYADDIAKGRRNAGAVDKADNIQRACKSILLPPRLSVAELGCGEGAVAEALSRLRFYDSYIGYDISASGIASADSRQVPKARFEQTSGATVPVPDKSVDLVVMSHVVEHLEHPRAMLYEANRIGSWAVVEVPLELNWRMPNHYTIDALGHINKYNSALIHQLLESCDMQIINEYTSNPSQKHALYGKSSLARRSMWHVKNMSLKAAGPIARGLFTYHHTILAKCAAR